MGYSRHKQPLYLGDRIKVRTIRGFKGNIIGRMPDGRTIIFDRDSPYYSMLGSGQLVECNVIRVSERYVLVDPVSEPELLEREGKNESETEPRERAEPPEMNRARLLEDLRILSEEGEWETAVIAEALTYMIETLDSSPEPTSNSSQNTDSMVEEPPVDHTRDSPLFDDFLLASSSFGLTQTQARGRKEPKSEFLRYLNGLQEKEMTEVEIPSSIRAELFGTVIDLPKDVRLLTVGQTRYLKRRHLRGLDGYHGIARFSTFFAEASALERREYGNMFYASMGTDPWQKAHKVTVDRVRG